MADDATIPATATPIDFDLLCTHCHYNLRGLAFGAACPECGDATRCDRLIDAPAVPTFVMNADFPCSQCGYNLRGIHLDSTCPECGLGMRSIVPLTGPVTIFAEARGDCLFFDKNGIVVFQQGVRHVIYRNEITGFSTRGGRLILENHWLDLALPDLVSLRRQLTTAWNFREKRPEVLPQANWRAIAIFAMTIALLLLLYMFEGMVSE